MNALIKIILPLSTLLVSVCSYAELPIFPPQPQARPQMPYAYPQQAQPYGYPQAYPQPYIQRPQMGRPQMGQPPAAYPQQRPSQERMQPQKAFKEFSGYLGLGTDILPSSVAAQLPAGHSQGILFKEFAKNSPASNSGLKPYDVIVAFGEKKISHPAQLIKFVRDGNPGETVVIKVVRQGSVLDIPVTLGAQPTPNPKTFNGLAIKQIGKDKYRAVLRFIGANGNKQVRTYEGDREEIFEQAMQAQDLPQAEREQLLFATRPRKGKSDNGFGSFFPFGNNRGGNDWMNPQKYFNPKMPW